MRPGIAEMRFGVGPGKRGVVIFLTLGTGVGSGVFNDGMLVPNTEFGQMEIRGRAAERRSAAAARVRRGLSWKAWAADLDEHLGRDRGADLAQPLHPGRRGQQERRQVHPAADGRTPGRRGAAPQRRRDHRRGDRRGGAQRRRRPMSRPAGSPDLRGVRSAVRPTDAATRSPP